MRKMIIIMILLPFFIQSCSKENRFETLYQIGDSETLCSESSASLHASLSEDALYWKIISSWNLSQSSDASSAAELYLMLYPESNHNHKIMAERAVLFLSRDVEKSIYAGKELFASGAIGKTGATKLYELLVKHSDPFASDVFAFLRPLLSTTEYAYLMVDTEADSETIILALEAMYIESGKSALYGEILNEAIFLLKERGDGAEIRDFALETAPEDDAELSMTIGDLLYSLSEYEEASTYWEKGREISPEGYRIRMRLLGR